MNDFLVVLDYGHALRSEHKKYTHTGSGQAFHKGETFYEGQSNVDIGKLVESKLRDLQIPFVVVSDNTANYDTPLTHRVLLENLYSQFYRTVLFISIHSNAGKGTGFEVWTSKGFTRSDVAASDAYKFFQKLFKDEYPVRVDYSDGDEDKEGRLYVNVHTKSASILCEFLFFDMLKQAIDLMKPHVQNKCAHVIILTILKFKQRYAL